MRDYIKSDQNELKISICGKLIQIMKYIDVMVEKYLQVQWNNSQGLVSFMVVISLALEVQYRRSNLEE